MRPFHLIMWFTLIVMAAGSVSADAIYQWRDEKGKIHFGDRPPAEEEAEPVTVKPNLYQAPKYKSSAASAREKVVMYSTKRCGYCKKARRYFKRNAIPFVEYDVETSQKGRRDYKRLGGRGVPIILVGERRMNGFSEAGFRQIYH